MHLAIIGGGPAGLRAAEVAAAAGAQVTLYEAKPSVGRKFLVAGRGGLNLSKQEPAPEFAQRYRGPGMPAEFWPREITGFDADAIRAWAGGFGIETFAASTGRIYPREMKAAPLLRRWLERLRAAGVQLHMRHRWVALEPGAPLGLRFETPGGEVRAEADAVILAMGGASWPETGSNGAWVSGLERLGVAVAPLQPANCGWECAWPAEFLAVAEGQPLKNIAASAGGERVRGELMITRYGLEGGAIYLLGAALRAQAEPVLTVDLRPDLSGEALVRKLGLLRGNFLAEARARWKLTDAQHALLALRGPYASAEELAAVAKAYSVAPERPRPMAEAISSAGGVAWAELDAGLMIQRLPGVFVAGEMVDWEAPTGGYLIHGSMAMGAHAARAAVAWMVSRG